MVRQTARRAAAFRALWRAEDRRSRSPYSIGGMRMATGGRGVSIGGTGVSIGGTRASIGGTGVSPVRSFC